MLGHVLPQSPVRPVDVVVRTSGERRISNFMLWQSAGAPVYFTEQTWPDFGASDLYQAVAEFQKRTRRFGKV